MGVKQFIPGVVVGFLIAGCAGISFPYHYYGLDAESYKGYLRGPTPKDDVDLSKCAPTSSDASPCTVMYSPIYLSLKQDYLDTKQQLLNCQHSNEIQ